jgi:hypothetical protein
VLQKLVTMDISLNAFVLIDIWSIPMLIHNLYKIPINVVTSIHDKISLKIEKIISQESYFYDEGNATIHLGRKHQFTIVM